MIGSGLILVVLGGIIVGWNLRSLWMAWKTRQFDVGSIQQGDQLKIVSANGDTEIVTAKRVTKTTTTVDK